MTDSRKAIISILSLILVVSAILLIVFIKEKNYIDGVFFGIVMFYGVKISTTEFIKKENDLV